MASSDKVKQWSRGGLGTRLGHPFGPRWGRATAVPDPAAEGDRLVTDAFATRKRAGCDVPGSAADASACVMQRGLARRVATCVGIVMSAALLGVAAAGLALASAPAALTPPLDVMPLPTVRVTGGYGEVRSNHVHAGVDLSTGGRVGLAVRAPLAGNIERVRTSGVGYGRSLYLRSGDGRLLVFGHLDAFAPAIATYADSAQRASGQYEQDLWPASARFHFAAGETIAWSGESGSGGPHLHFEVRHGDFALDPLLAGIPQPGHVPPRLESLTLEPLSERAWVARRAAPFTLPLRAPGETLLVEGVVRAVVRSRAGLPGVRGAPAWLTSAAWNGARIEARLDSISWAGEMAELDLVVDRGRITGGQGFILWRPPGVSPRFLVSDSTAWDGTIDVHAGDPARPLVLRARDASGREVERTVWLRGPGAHEGGPATKARGTGHAGEVLNWSFAALPAGRLRVRLAGAPAGLGALRIATGAGDAEEAASWDGAAWSAVLAPVRVPQGGPFIARGRLADGSGWTAREPASLWPAGEDQTLQPAEFAELVLAPASVFERGVIVARTGRPPKAGAQGLSALGPTLELSPEHEPLRRAVPIVFALPPGTDPAGVDIYRRSGGGWDPLRARWDDASRRLRGETSSLGAFALLRDGVAPQVVLQQPARVRAATPYPRWQLVARVVEHGSGVDASGSAFTVDGVRVPSEWDPERNELRWRPLRKPAVGAHAVLTRVVDRAGHATEREGRFVLDSMLP